MKELHLGAFPLEQYITAYDASVEKLIPAEPLRRETYESILQTTQRIAKACALDGIDPADLPAYHYQTKWLTLSKDQGLAIYCYEYPDLDTRLNSPIQNEAVITIEDPIFGGMQSLALNQPSRSVIDTRYYSTAPGNQILSVALNQSAGVALDKWLADAATTLRV